MKPRTPPSSTRILPPTPTSLPRNSKSVNPSSTQIPPQQSRQLSSSTAQEPFMNQDRIICALPKSKRQRINSDSDSDDQSLAANQVINSTVTIGLKEGSLKEGLEEIDSFPLSLNNEVSKEFRPRTKIPLTTTISHSTTTTNTDDTLPITPEYKELDLEETSSLPSLTSSSSIQSTSVSSTSPSSNEDHKEALEAEEQAPGYFHLFGEAGEKVVRSLSTASPYSSSGIFGCLGLASLLSRNHGSSCHGTQTEEEEEEDSFAYGREKCSGDNRIISAVDGQLQLGNNKKKRKIPGVSRGAHTEDDDRAFDGEEELVDVEVPKSSIIQRSDFATGLVPKSSSALPTTAKAALAKLRYRPPHISLITTVSSRRKYNRKFYKDRIALFHPVSTPAPNIYSPPASYLIRPASLPPGSKLKGSKAIKVAQKAEKDREKEKERMKLALGGNNINLPNFWDPNGTLAAEARARRRRGSEIHSGYVTPPASSDEGDGTGSPSSGRRVLPSILPTIDTFEFSSSAPVTLQTRWQALQEQIIRLQIAKNRALKAREEEKKRRLEKEIELAKEAAAEAKNLKKSPITTKRTSLATSSVQPVLANTTTTPTTTSNLSPSLSTNDLTLSPPTRKVPLKGKKKRSAHANANNSHHINNFVPSRAPVTSHHSSSYTDSMPPPLTSWPASEEAIAAAEAAGVRVRDRSNGSFFAGADEWLCARCDYEIFYGEESSLARMIKQRKKVLKVRRKAKERAAKAANGGVAEEN